LFLEEKKNIFPKKTFFFSPKKKQFSKDLLLFLEKKKVFSPKKSFFFLQKIKKIMFLFFEKTSVNPLRKKEKILKKKNMVHPKNNSKSFENCI
jgi:hypothetical protein